MTVPPPLLGLRYRGEGGHVESWFLVASEPRGRRAVWLGATVFARCLSADRAREPVPPVAEAWAIAFERGRVPIAAKTTVPLGDARFAHGNLDVEVDGCALSLGRARGSVATGGRAVAWDLAVGPARAAPVVHLPAALYDRPVPSSKLVTPLSDAPADGVVLVRPGPGEAEERWHVAGWPATVAHHWGPARAHLYAWAHCNTWDDAEDLVFEGLSARVRMGRIPLLSPMITGAHVRYRGERFELPALDGLGKNRGAISLRRWEMSAEHRGVSVVAELSAETDALAGLHETNPRGSMTYRLCAPLARARLELRLPGGRTVIAHSRAAAIELGTRDPGHGVRMVL